MVGNSRLVRRLGMVFALALAGAVPAAHGASSSVACHRQGVRPTPDFKLGYRQRGDRCEGLYLAKVSAVIGLEVLGIHAGAFASLPLRPDQELQVGVQRGTGETVLVEATALRVDTYYAMDTTQLDRVGRFRWSADVVGAPALALRGDELGVLACIEPCRGTAEPLYLPVRMEVPAAAGDAVTAVLRAQVDLRQVEVTVTAPDGRRTAETLRRSRVADRPFSVNLRGLGSGINRVRIVARFPDGDRDVVVFRVRA